METTLLKVYLGVLITGLITLLIYPLHSLTVAPLQTVNPKP